VNVTDDEQLGLGPPGRVSGRQLREQLADDAWLDELIERADRPS
jgi:putative transposase